MYEPCFGYDQTSQECLDYRKSHVTALVLSILLSSLGAANFYIDQTWLGVAQLSILLVLVTSVCLCTSYLCCLVCCEDECEDCCCESCWGCCECCDGETNFVYTFVCVTCLALALTVVIVCWWAVDLAVFSLNARGDGNGCPLIS